MRVFSVCVFACLLLQTAILEAEEPDQAQILQIQSKPNLPQNPRLSVTNKAQGALVGQVNQQQNNKTDPNLEDRNNAASEKSTVSVPSVQPTEPTEEIGSTQNPKPKPTQGSKKEPEVSSAGLLSTDQCVRKKYTRDSCSKVFCPPWKRCIEGQCICKIPYKCPRQDLHACTLDGSQYYSMCQANAIACRSNTPTFSHLSSTCREEDAVSVDLEIFNDQKVILIKIKDEKKLVCGWDWNIAAANVVCRSNEKNNKGAEEASKIKYTELTGDFWPTDCVRVRCTGNEFSLAECMIYKPLSLLERNGSVIAVSKCYEKTTEDCKSKFRCANEKCVSSSAVCNGVDNCGDNSDEMCCQRCQDKGEGKKNPFLCKSGVCIPHHAVGDGIRDCLGGEDEVEPPAKTEDLLFDPKSEIRKIRLSEEDQLKCGIPNLEYVYKPESDGPSHSRKKRLVGGEEALPTQIQWQVAIQDEGSIHCGGVYLGGCWVLTAAHCVRPKPKSFRVKFSLWMKHRRQSTTDSIPVKKVIIHEAYSAQTYTNDIALLQLEPLNLSDKCMLDNPAVRAVCVPWSMELIQPNHTCTISGWGRNREGMSASILKWANVTIIGDCNNYYGKRFLPGMECAGDLEGKVDSCQGDSGGPLVCKDASGLSYVWGIVSWGDKCGEANSPGVYTKVAHYFDWIRFHTGWAAITKFNQ